MRSHCHICNVEIRESMGFVLVRDTLFPKKVVRVYCEKCSWGSMGKITLKLSKKFS